MKHTKILYIVLCLILCAGMCLSFWDNAVSPTFSYGFDPADKENFVLEDAATFRSLLPKDVLAIVFTDALSPHGATLTDLSVRKEGGVVGWLSEDVFIISTRTKGEPVIFNPDSAGLFAELSTLEAVDLGMVDTSRVQDFMRFFYNCTALGAADISSFSFDSAIRTRSMFMNCVSLKEVTVGDISTSTLRDTAFMFSGTSTLDAIDLSHCDLSAVICTTAMFQNTGAKTVHLPDSLSVLGSFFLNHATRYEGETFTLPASAKELSGAHLFYNMGGESFSSFLVPEGNEYYKSVDGVLYSSDGERLLAVPKGKRFDDGVLEIAEGATLLGELCLSRNTNAKTLLLPNCYRVSVYTAQNHKDFADISGSGNKNTGNSLNLATYLFSGITSFAVKADNPLYTAVSGALYERGEDGSAKALVALPVGFAGALDIPEGVTQIRSEAIWTLANASFDGLTEIRIPASLTEIDLGQLEKINSLGVPLTVDGENSVYTVSAEGFLVKK